MGDTMDRMRQPARGDDASPHPGRSTHLAIEVLSAYIDHALPPADRARADAHLATCEACRQELRELTTTVALLGTLPEPRPRRSFQLSPAQIQARVPWWQRLGERLLPRLPAVRAAAVAVALLLVAVTAIDLLQDNTTSPSHSANPPGGLVTSIAPHGALPETSVPEQAKELPTSTGAGQSSQTQGSLDIQSASNTLAAEPMPTLTSEAAGRVASGSAPRSSVDATAVAESLDNAGSSRAAEAPAILAGESAPAAPAMGAAASPPPAPDAGIMSIAEEGVSQAGLVTATEAPASALITAASPAGSPLMPSPLASTPAAMPSPTQAASATPTGMATQGAPEPDGGSVWRTIQIVLAGMLGLLLLTLLALQRLRSRRTV